MSADISNSLCILYTSTYTMVWCVLLCFHHDFVHILSDYVTSILAVIRLSGTWDATVMYMGEFPEEYKNN